MLIIFNEDTKIILLIIIYILTDNQSDNEAICMSDSNDDSGLDVKSINNGSMLSSSPTENPENKVGLLKVILS